MTRFRFSLARVLELRRTQLEMEEARLQKRTAAIAELDGKRADVEAAGLRAETEVRGRGAVAGRDLEALGAYRLRVRQQALEIVARRVECEREADEQRITMMEARRRVRLLERLQERRHAEWRASADKELDDAASEAYLAKWTKSSAADKRG